MRDTNLLFFGKLFTSALNFLGFILLARYMDIEIFGEYSLSIAYAGVFNLVIFQFIRVSIVRLGMNNDENLKQLSSLFIKIFLFNLIVILLLFAVGSNKVFFVMAGMSLGCFEITQEICRVQEQNRKLVVNTIVRSLVFFISVYFTIYFNLISLSIILIIFSFSYLIIGLAKVYDLRNHIFVKTKPQFIRQVLMYSLPICFSTGMIYLVDYFDRYYINLYLSSEELGLYSGAYTLAQQSVGVILMAINMAFYPTLVKEYDRNRDKFDKLRQSYLTILLVFIVAMVFYASVYDVNIVTLILGNGFQSASSIFSIIVVSICIGCFKSYFIDIEFFLEKKTKLIFYNSILSATTNIALNIYLIPKFGITGAALATLSTFIISASVSYIMSKKIVVRFETLLRSLKYCAVFVVLTLVINYFFGGNDYILAMMLSTVVIMATTLTCYRSVLKRLR
ncbi:oligosaccharide flippase family protein [Vibrio breoganii]